MIRFPPRLPRFPARFLFPVLPALLLGGAGMLWAAAGMTGTDAPVAVPESRPVGVAAGPGDRPGRVVSLNLCADQLLLALADRDQIAGLTPNAGDADMSAAAGEARGLPILGNSAEQIMVIDPDLVVGMPARRSAALGALRNRDYRTLDLPSAADFDEIKGTIRDTAAAIGHPRRGAALIADMERRLAAVPRLGEGKVAAYYQRRGYLTGTGTLIDDLMGRLGLTNLAATLGKPALSYLSLEEVVAAQPDYLIVESATDRVADQGTEMLHHPALRDIPRIRLPQAWTVCGGPAYVLAAQTMAAQIARHRGGG